MSLKTYAKAEWSRDTPPEIPESISVAVASAVIEKVLKIYIYTFIIK